MRILVVHPHLSAIGGGNAVAAWTLQGLREEAELTLLGLEPPDFAGVNRTFGTDLRASDFDVQTVTDVPSWWPWMPTQASLVRMMLLMRACRELDRKRRFDRLVCTSNEFDFGRPGIQYVHYPWAYLPRPATERTLVHRIPGAVRAYQSLAAAIAPVSARRVRANRTLANSQFVRGRYERAWAGEASVVHPPVPGGFPEVAWENRADAFVCVGRLHREQRPLLVLAIVAGLRRGGDQLERRFPGTVSYSEHEAELRDRIAENGDWAKVHVGLSRRAMVEQIARQRYGIHAMVEEHFGIAPAELQRAGCITFAHNSGGPVEILGGDERVLFDTAEDAVEKIEAVLRSETRQRELGRAATSRAERFSEERFVDEMRREVLGGWRGPEERAAVD